jgi:hypothetical protein
MISMFVVENRGHGDPGYLWDCVDIVTAASVQKHGPLLIGLSQLPSTSTIAY